ncbi:ureidoglycolate lyase [Bordetella genomosp. 13]|uniref:ureidoglycolate lyase n=1 Tax=Bordetella genomosp. 13 TaxID=463040 RepID=UPI0011A6580B|nr:ureidoglycolate lyase [Bordetella genomosp. 13]
MDDIETLPLRRLERQAFARYGWMLGKPMPAAQAGVPVFSNPATDFWQEHVFDAGSGGEPEVLWVRYRSADRVVANLEVHLLTHQAIVPLTGPIIQVVAASATDGRPDLATLAAFEVPVGQGICMRPGCWHATRIAAAGEVTCLMLTRRSTTADLIAHLAGAPASESAIVPLTGYRLESA